jgi:hypothetical protein
MTRARGLVCKCRYTTWRVAGMKFGEVSFHGPPNTRPCRMFLFIHCCIPCLLREISWVRRSAWPSGSWTWPVDSIWYNTDWTTFDFNCNHCLSWDSTDFHSQTNVPSGMDWKVITNSLTHGAEPPIVQLHKNFTAFYGIRRFITVFTRAIHWSLSWVRSIQSISQHPV